MRRTKSQREGDRNRDCLAVVAPIIPAFRRLRQEDGEFNISLGHIVGSKPD
jgi:hypothetical protein